jgi:GNAT superfamily N-acetyltransferase
MARLAVGSETVEIRRVQVERIIDLRHVILRAGLPRETAVFPGDDAATSRHYAAVVGGGGEERVVGCTTLHLNQYENEPAWQLRGMAVEPAFQSKGVGRALVEILEREALEEAPGGNSDEAVRLLWCNARTPAVAFYRKLGWRTVSEEFVIPTAGPHYRMMKRI